MTNTFMLIMRGTPRQRIGESVIWNIREKWWTECDDCKSLWKLLFHSALMLKTSVKPLNAKVEYEKIRQRNKGVDRRNHFYQQYLMSRNQHNTVEICPNWLKTDNIVGTETLKIERNDRNTNPKIRWITNNIDSLCQI